MAGLDGREKSQLRFDARTARIVAISYTDYTIRIHTHHALLGYNCLQ